MKLLPTPRPAGDLSRHALPLARLLGHTADAVQGVRAGQSLTTLLASCPVEARAGTQALSFQVLRRLGSAQAARSLLAPKTPPPAVDALLLSALALLWPGDNAAYSEHTLVDQAVTAARQRHPASASFVNAVLRRFLRERAGMCEAAQRDPQAVFDHPAWWVERLRRDWPSQWQDILRANNQRAPMTLRVNVRRGGAAGGVNHGLDDRVADDVALDAARGAPDAIAACVAAYQARLTEAGIESRAVGACALQLAAPVPVHQLPGFADGDVSVQDAAAQLAAPLLLGWAPGLNSEHESGRPAAQGGLGPLPPGARVLDACAAPGGKTAHLLEWADLDLLAIDSDALRLRRVDETLARLSLTARTVAADAAQPGAWWDGRPFDAILLDAPCSASGIVRRHPDVRWLRRPGDIARLAARQAALLDALWPLLSPGGRLLYCTCSVFKAEGQDMVDAFVQRQPGVELAPAPVSPGHLLPLHDNEEAGGGASQPPSLGAAADGFFYALLQKI